MRRFVKPLTWLLISACVFSAIVRSTMQRGAAPLSPRYVLYAIPAAISILRGYPHDYTAQMSLAEPFFYHSDGDTNSQIKQQLSAPITEGSELLLVSGDDKGLIDLTYAAFVIFGPSTNSIIKAIVSLIGLSAILFFLQFKREDVAMAAMIAVLGGLYAVLRTLGITNEFFSLTEPRLCGCISLIASLHLMLLATREDRLRWSTAILAIAQLCIVIFVIHIRLGEFWQVLAIAGFSLSIIAFRRSFESTAAAIVALSVVGAIGLSAYKHAVYNPRYFKDEISTRAVWHNALMGLAINPDLRDKYGIEPLSDERITGAVKRYMIQDGRSDEAASLFRDNFDAHNFLGFDWSLYEMNAKGMYLHILRHDPGEVARTLLVIAPQIAWMSAYFLSNRGIEVPREYDGKPVLSIAPIVSPETRKQQDLYFSLVRRIPLLAMLASIIAIVSFRSRLSPYPLLATMCLFGLSLIPPALASPAPQYLMASLSIAAALIHLLAVTACVWLIRFLLSARPNSKAVRSRQFVPIR